MAISIGFRSEEAEKYAEQGDYTKAAEAWEKVDRFDRAFENWAKVGKEEDAKLRAREKAEGYESSKRWTKAAFVWDQLDEHARAGAAWEKSNNWLKAIDSWKRSGNKEMLADAVEKARQRAKKYETDKAWFWAAKYWENLQEWAQAALAWERDEKYAEAAICWERCGRWLEASNNWKKIGDERAGKNLERAENEARAFEREKLFLKAANLWKGLGEWEKAAYLFERERAWLEASEAWKMAGEKEKAKAAEDIGKEQLKDRHVPFLEEKWQDLGEMDKASESWSKSEWRGIAEKFEGEGNVLDAAHGYTEAEEWKKAGELWEKAGCLIEARNCWQNASELDKVSELERKIREDAVVYERKKEYGKAAENWEALNEWTQAAENWEKIDNSERLSEAKKNSAIKNELYDNWYRAALERKEIGDSKKAIEDFEKCIKAKKPEEREFYRDVILQAEVLDKLQESKRMDWVAYYYLVKASMGDSVALKKILKMEADGEPYVLYWLGQNYMLAAHWNDTLGLCKEFIHASVKSFREAFSKVLLRETKIKCLEYIISEYESLFVIAERMEDNETLRESMEELRLYINAYMKISSSKNLTEEFVRRLVAFYFLEENWKRAKKLCKVGEERFGGEFYKLSYELAESLETASNIEAALLLYSYTFNIPKEIQDTKDAFLKGMWIPNTFLNSPEYIVRLVAESKAELQDELRERYKDILEKADKEFGGENFEEAKKLYEEFLSFPLTIGLEARVLKNLVKCASKLKKDKDKRRFERELSRIG